MRERGEQHLGTELKAVARDALRLGVRFAEAGRAWLTEKTEAMMNRNEQSNWRDDEQGRGRSGAGGSQRSWQSGESGSGFRSSDEHGQYAREPWERNREYASQGGGDWGDGGSGREYGHGQYAGQQGGGYLRAGESHSFGRYGAGESRGYGEGYGTSSGYASGTGYGGGYGGGYGQSGGYGGGRMGGGAGFNESGTSGSNFSSTYGGGSAGIGQGGEMYGGQQRRQSFRGRGPRNYTRSDERILEDIYERLTNDDDIDATEVTVSCQDGHVVLEGEVEARWVKHRIEDIVEACGGVKDIDNRLKVRRTMGDRLRSAFGMESHEDRERGEYRSSGGSDTRSSVGSSGSALTGAGGTGSSSLTGTSGGASAGASSTGTAGSTGRSGKTGTGSSTTDNGGTRSQH